VASDSPFSTTSTSGRLDAEALRDFKVLVAGATGGCGRKVVETLVAHNVPVRALVRDLDKAVSCTTAEEVQRVTTSCVRAGL
jgi:short-subunit dehydrogenase